MDGGFDTRGTPLRPNDPRSLGDYRMLRRLGEGGMGSVFLADSPAGRVVALKVIRADLVEQPEFRRRFRSEVARAQQVPPFCTAEVLDADPDHEMPYLVVEFVDGPSLSEVILDRGPLTPSNLYGLAIGVATALSAIHGAGVIHRDLKPSNVLLAPGSPKVIDFGIARATETGDGDTHTDQLIGTVAYMAPERLDPGPSGRTVLTSAADVFAWGAVVAFAATGRVPFLGDSAPATAVSILTQEPNLDGLHGQLRELVGLALAKDPAARPSARTLLDRLLSQSGEVRPVDPALLRTATASNAFVQVPVRDEATSAASAVDLFDDEESLGAAEVSLATGMRHAHVDMTREMPIVADDDAVPYGAQEVDDLRGGGPSWRIAGIVALVLLVLALAATVAGMATGYIKPPGSGAAAATSSTAPSSSPSIAYDPLFTDPLTLGSDTSWNDSSLAGWGGCAVAADGLEVSLLNNATYRCLGQQADLQDFKVTVDVTLVDADACAGIWLRFNEPRGYAVQICQNQVRLVSHDGTKPIHTIFSQALADPSGAKSPLPIDRPAHIEIDAAGYTFTVLRDGVRVFSIYDANRTYATGHIVLGIFQEQDNVPYVTGKSLYRVRFANIAEYQVVP